STTSSSGSGSDGENKQSKHLHHHQDDTILTSTTNSSFNIQQPGLQHMNRCYTSVNSADYRNYFAKQRAEIEATSFSSSDLEPTTFSNASSSSSLNSDSTMALDTLTVTLHLNANNYLSISIVGQTDKTGSTDGGIYVSSITKGGVVAEDGRIEPGDMILQVNNISFEKLSNDDAAEILREAGKTPGYI
ncbi:unnamed protein product, partial [Rotaria sp. Silwood1]